MLYGKHLAQRNIAILSKLRKILFLTNRKGRIRAASRQRRTRRRRIKREERISQMI